MTAREIVVGRRPSRIPRRERRAPAEVPGNLMERIHERQQQHETEVTPMLDHGTPQDVGHDVGTPVIDPGSGPPDAGPPVPAGHHDARTEGSGEEIRVEQLKQAMRDHPGWDGDQYARHLGLSGSAFWKWMQANKLSLRTLRSELGLPQIMGTRRGKRGSRRREAKADLPAGADGAAAKPAGASPMAPAAAGEPAPPAGASGEAKGGTLELPAEPPPAPEVAGPAGGLEADNKCATCAHVVVCVIPELMDDWLNEQPKPVWMAGKLAAINFEPGIIIRRCEAYRPAEETGSHGAAS